MAFQMFRKSPVIGRAFLCVDEFHELSFDRCKDGAKVMPAFQNCAAFADQRPHALAVAQSGAFFDAIFGAFGGATKHAEHSSVAAQVNGKTSPFSRRAHPSISVQYPMQFIFFQAYLIMPTLPT